MKFDPNMTTEIYNQLPQSTKEALLTPPAKAIGKGLHGMFTILFAPLVALGGITEVKVNDLIKRTQFKAQQIPLENQDFSKPGLLIKALEESKYSIDEELLREMFANLIVSGIDKRKNSELTPRYATILAQLGIKEAELLKFIHEQSSPQIPVSKAIARFHLLSMPDRDGYRNLSDLFVCSDKQKEIKTISLVSLSILSSLGIITYDSEFILPGKEANGKYNVLKRYIRSSFDFTEEVHTKEQFEILEGNINLTDLGLNLFQYIF